MTEKGRRLLDVLWRALRDLERYRDTYSSEQVVSSPDARRMILHALYEASQASIDLGLHILSVRGLDVPSSYQEVFSSLERAGVISAELAGQMRGWAGLRNVLAHFYPMVDFGRVDAVLREGLGRLEEYARAIELA